MNLLMILVICAAVLALAFAAFNFFKVKKMPEGTEQMSEIASAIRVGANAFINYEYKVLYTVVAVVAVIMAIVTTWHAALALLIGSIMSGCAGMIGMKIATYANVRVSNKARETEDIGETVKVAFRGGSVMGLCVGGFALLGLFLVYMIFGLGMHQAVETNASYVNLIGLKFVPFTMTLSGYALGCSMVAMFNRVGGGIYTKAADMGADLVGKTEAHIPEDDPRNPATIADNVGDNVGDVAGLGSDLLESYVGAITSGIILAFHMFMQSKALGTGMDADLLQRCILFPLVFVAIGLIACCIGVASLLFKAKMSKDPHKDLNGATYVSAGADDGPGPACRLPNVPDGGQHYHAQCAGLQLRLCLPVDRGGHRHCRRCHRRRVRRALYLRGIPPDPVPGQGFSGGTGTDHHPGPGAGYEDPAWPPASCWRLASSSSY